MFSRTNLGGLLFPPGTFLLPSDGLARVFKAQVNLLKFSDSSHPQHVRWQDGGSFSWLSLGFQPLAVDQLISQQAGMHGLQLGQCLAWVFKVRASASPPASPLMSSDLSVPPVY